MLPEVADLLVFNDEPYFESPADTAGSCEEVARFAAVEPPTATERSVAYAMAAIGRSATRMVMQSLIL